MADFSAKKLKSGRFKIEGPKNNKSPNLAVIVKCPCKLAESGQNVKIKSIFDHKDDEMLKLTRIFVSAPTSSYNQETGFQFFNKICKNFNKNHISVKLFRLNEF